MAGKFCHGKFWDFNETWNNEVPDFSSCFQDIVFILLPCLSFAVILTFSLCQISGLQGQRSPLPWTWLNLMKICLSVLLSVAKLFHLVHTLQRKSLGETVPYSSLISTSAQILVYVLTVVCMLKHKSHGVKTSTSLSSYWFIHFLCNVFLCRSFIMHVETYGISFAMNILYYFVSFVQLVLSVFVDKHSHTLLQEGKVMEEISLLPSMTFQWFTKVVYKSWKKKISVSDLSFTDKRLTTSCAYTAFSKHWNSYLTEEPKKNSGLAWSLFKGFWKGIVLAAVLNLFFLISVLLPPLLLDLIINLTHDDIYPWRGYFFAVTMFLADYIGKMVQNISYHYMYGASIQFNSSLLGAIYRKNLCMSTAARKEYNSGSLTSLVSVDVKKVQDFHLHVTALINAPIKIFFIIYLLWLYIGPATVSGVIVILALLPTSCFVSRLSDKFTTKRMAEKDVRMNYTNEFLNGIKILKLYAWEIPFAAKVTETRKNEIRYIRYSLYFYFISTFAYFIAPFMVSLASFAAFLLSDPANVLDPVKAFVSLTLISQLRFALFELPDAINALVQCRISLKRLTEFLTAENMDTNAVGNDPEKDEVLTIKDASWSWDKKSECILHNINLNVPKRMLIAIIGPVGSGKSSLLSAILGEMNKMSGSMDIKGSIAYVPQQPWVLNRTLKKNILLVKHMSEEKYKKILDLCCLTPDLDILPAGHDTEIGEKGVNLSGGQKLRINLAQAVYQDKEIYLLDDPLSAVDVHVRKSLFKNVIGNTGLLRKKTRLLVTHDTSVLPDVDLIVSMKCGRIDEIGTYEELLSRNGSFTHFMDEHCYVEPKEPATEDNLSSLKKHRMFQRTLSLLSGKSVESSGGGDFLDLDEDWSSFRLIDDEEMETGGVHRKIYLKYVQNFGIPLFVFSTFWFLAYAVFNAGANIWLSDWSEDIARNGTQEASATTWRLSIYGVMGLCQVISVVMASYLLIYGTTKAASKYHNNMLESVMKSPMSFFDSTPLGRIVNRFTTDMETLDTSIFYRIHAWLTCLFATIAAFIIIGMNTPVFIATLLPISVIYYSVQTLHLNTFRQTKRLDATTKSIVLNHFLESIHGVSSISAYKVKEDFIKNFEEKIDFNNVCLFSSNTSDRWLNFWLNTLGSMIVLITALLAVENRDKLTPATIGLIVSYALAVTEALRWLVKMNSELEDNSIAIERVNQYCHLKSEAPWTLDDDEDVPEDWPTNGDITFYNYCTKYREDLDFVLKDINLSVKASEKIGIVGRTGAGKSSFTLALFRIIEPVLGTILIDDIDITKMGLHKLRSKITIIPQDPVLFTGSLRNNLDPDGKYTDEDIWESLEKSYLKSYVLNLNEGLEFKLEENGSNFSAGQKQLVCLARALLKNSKILVLDEATASIDLETDNLIQSTIRTAFEDRTVITIAHRLNTVLDYDKIVVMESGSVVEFGSPSSLIQDTESRFYKMNKEAGLI